jgi:hypothetical protein
MVCMIACARARAGDVPYTFTKVVDQNAALPGSSAPPPFYFEYWPSLSEGNIAFSTSRSFPTHGLFATDGANLWRAVDRSTPLPNGVGTMQFLNGFSQDGGATVFNALTEFGFQGVFRFDGGALTTIADANTALPATDGKQSATLTFAFIPSAEHGAVAFNGQTSLGQGIFSDVTGTMKAVADRFTAVPGTPGAVFSSVGAPILRGGKIAFSSPQFAVPNGTGVVPGQGIYRADPADGTINRLVDLTTAKPGGGTFGDLVHQFGDQLSLADFDGLHIVFYVNTTKALYTDLDGGGGIRTVVDENTLIPGSSVHFGNIGASAIDDGRVIFSGGPGNLVFDPPTALYAWQDGSISRILSAGDIVDGKTVRSINFGADSLDGDHFAAVLGFTDGTSAIYQTVIPEPAAAGLTASGLILLTLLRRGRTRRRI